MEEYRPQAKEYRELDDKRAVVFVDSRGRGKISGLDLRQLSGALIGAGLIAAPGPMLSRWGYPRNETRSPAVRALLRTVGGRDLVLGLATLAARQDDRAMRRIALASAALDSRDTLLSAALLAASPSARKPASAW